MIFEIDEIAGIVYVNGSHLNKRPLWMIENNIISFYTLTFGNLKCDVKSGLRTLKNKGYSAVLRFKEKNLILFFNQSLRPEEEAIPV